MNSTNKSISTIPLLLPVPAECKTEKWACLLLPHTSTFDILHNFDQLRIFVYKIFSTNASSHVDEFLQNIEKISKLFDET